jgi:hypothetical protein
VFIAFIAPELFVRTAQDDDGQSFLYCKHKEGMSRCKTELRHYLLQGAADLIKGQSPR